MNYMASRRFTETPIQRERQFTKNDHSPNAQFTDNDNSMKSTTILRYQALETNRK